MTAKRNKDGRPNKQEIALIKAMINRFAKIEKSDQDILAYFSRPERSLNHRVIGEIRKNQPYAANVRTASDAELDGFLLKWPNVDDVTGLHLENDELLIKAREAMLTAIQSFNNPQTHFRSETFIVLAVIAWTYLIHAFYKKSKLDYRYAKKDPDGKTVIMKTPNGGDRYWDLKECLSKEKCPFDAGTKNNLNELMIIRDEIEHRMTNSIDVRLAASFQACCLNFNREIKTLFGPKLRVDQKMSIALQLASFDIDQTNLLLQDDGLPSNIATAIQGFENNLSLEEKNDEHFACRISFKRVAANNGGEADRTVQFYHPSALSNDNVQNVYFKEMEKKKYLRREIIQKMYDLGYVGFGPYQHTTLVKQMNAQDPAKNFGVLSPGKSKAWCWYDSWVKVVEQHCSKNKARYTRPIGSSS